MSDFLEQNRDAIEADADGAVDADPNWTGSHLTPFERLWLCLFGQLAVLCVDDRPPVRKSACQTLFQTINTYGHVLTQKAWEPVVWKVLYSHVISIISVSKASGPLGFVSDAERSAGTVW